MSFISNLNKGAHAILYISKNLLSKQELKRTPEPSIITTSGSDIYEYSQVMNTSMITIYCMFLTIIKQCTGKDEIKNCLDLCSGPGRLTAFLHEHLKIKKTIGVDLSDGMLKVANDHSKDLKKEAELSFSKANITNLQDYENKSFDLVTFADGAHHLDSINTVQKTLEEAERVCTDEGMVILLDPIRQKTESLTKLYLEVAGKDYLDHGLDHFYQQFKDSIYAAWTVSELKNSLPRDTSKKWFQISPRGLELFQIIIGIPHKQDKLFKNKAIKISEIKKLIPKKYFNDYLFLHYSFKFAKIKDFS